MKTPFRVAQVLIFLFALTACNLNPGTSGSTQSPPEAPTPGAGIADLGGVETPVSLHGTITIRHSWGEADLSALVQIIDLFRRQHPEVYFDVLYVPAQDLRLWYETETREGRGPDILLGPGEWAQSLFESGLTGDLHLWFDLQPPAALIPPALESFRDGEALMGLPYAVSGVVLYRNRDIITISPTDLEELVNLASTATRGEVLGASLERSVFFSAAHLFGIGGQLMDENRIPAFNNPTGLAWIEILRRFEAAGPPNYFSDVDIEAFEEGRVGWIIDGTWNLERLAAAIGPDKLAIDPWPEVDQGRMAGFLRPDGIYIRSGIPADHLPVVQAFLRHFISSDAQTILVEAGYIPAAMDITLTDPVKGSLIRQAMEALSGDIPYPNNPEMELYTQQLDLALRQVFEQGVPPEVALQEAADAIRAALANSTPTP